MRGEGLKSLIRAKSLIGKGPIFYAAVLQLCSVGSPGESDILRWNLPVNWPTVRGSFTRKSDNQKFIITYNWKKHKAVATQVKPVRMKESYVHFMMEQDNK